MSDVIGIWNVDWPNANSQRKYPLHPSATARDVSDTFTLPTDVLISIYLPVPSDADFDPERAYLKLLGVYPSSIVVMIGYDDGVDNPTIATAIVPTEDLEEYAVFPLSGVGDFANIDGRVQVGRPSSIDGLSLGEFTFDRDGGRLDSDCIRPVLPAVNGLVLINGSDRSDVLTGIIELVAGNNVRLTSTPVYESAVLVGYEVRIDAIQGEGLNEDCICDGQDPAGIPILTINGQPPDSEGNFDLSGDDCLNVTTAVGDIDLTDGCSKPCCGLEAVDRIEADVRALGAARAQQAEFVARLADSFSTLAVSLSSLKLNDISCDETGSEGP